MIVNLFLYSGMESRDPTWYAQLVSGLTDDQRKALHEIYMLADQRLAAAGKCSRDVCRCKEINRLPLFHRNIESKKIEKTGGYQFNTTNVPTNFNFSSGPPASLSP